MVLLTNKEILCQMHDGISSDIIRNEINVIWYTKKLKEIKGKGKVVDERRKEVQSRINVFSDAGVVGAFYLKEIKKRLKEC